MSTLPYCKKYVLKQALQILRYLIHLRYTESTQKKLFQSKNQTFGEKIIEIWGFLTSVRPLNTSEINLKTEWE